MDGQGFKPSRGFTSAYSLVSMTQQIAALAKALERDDASSWAKEAEDLRASFDEAWLHADSSDDASLYDRGLQSNQVLGLALMGPQADGTEAALRKLADALSATAHHLSTGIIGTRHLFDVLLDQGAGEYEDLKKQKKVAKQKFLDDADARPYEARAAAVAESNAAPKRRTPAPRGRTKL